MARADCDLIVVGGGAGGMAAGRATGASGIWAVGNVAGRLQFTHAADEMGRVAAANALSPRWRRHGFDPLAIPWVTFTTPEVAGSGWLKPRPARHEGRVAFLP